MIETSNFPDPPNAAKSASSWHGMAQLEVRPFLPNFGIELLTNPS
jgi:hypothetical protein